MSTDANSGKLFTTFDAHPVAARTALSQVLDQMAELPAIRRVRRVGREAMRMSPGQRLLDVGCGLGEEARQLAGLVGPGGQVTAVDLSTEMLAIARERDDGAVRYAVGDVMKLDFPDAVFDRVRSERVMQHVPDPDLAVAELARVTAPGGRVCLIDTDWDSFLMDGVPTDLLAQLRQAASLTGATLTTAGRFLRGRMVRAGLTEVTAEPVAIAMTDRHTVQALVPYFSRRVIHDVLRVPGELADAWFSAVDESLARGDFLAVFTMWVAAGTKAA